MLRIIAFIIVVGFFAWLVPKMMKPSTEATQPVYSGTSMTTAELSYYLQIFDYTMDNVKPNQSYGWASFNASGNIAVSAAFISKSGSTCRTFKENFNIGGQIWENQGVGCKRNGRDGWCKLKTDNAYTCSMEDQWVDIPGMPSINTAGIQGITTSSSVAKAASSNGGGIGSTNVNTNVDIHIDEKKAGTGYADTVTGTAGAAAGPITKGALGLYNDVFR